MDRHTHITEHCIESRLAATVTACSLLQSYRTYDALHHNSRAMKSDLLKKKQILDIFDNLDDSDDDEPDQGRRASEQALKKKPLPKAPLPPVRADSRALARSASDTTLNSRALARKVDVDAVPSSTDPLNASRNKYPLPGTLKKSVSDVARKPAAPAPVTGKRKRESSFKSAPEDQQIFRGLVFFFFPNDDKNPVRRMRINKAREYGAVWQRDFDDQVTHVVSDKNMDFASLLKWLQLEQLPSQVKAVSEAWPAECLAYKTLLDSTHTRFAIKGHQQRVEPQVPSTKPLVSVADFSESDKSLHLKPPGKDVTVREAETPSREGVSMESTAVIDFAGEREPTRIPASFIDTTIDSSKELDDAIAQARQLQHIPLDDEEANSRPTSSEGPLSDDESGSGGLKLLAQRKTQRKRLREQEKWQCMQKHDGNKSGNPNEATIDVLQQMADYYGQIVDEWRIRAYRKAIATLRNHSVKVSTKEEAGALPNVGPRLAEKIEEIAFTNRLRRLDNAKAEPQDQVLQTFMGVYGAGPKKAAEWVEQGYQTLDELMEKAELTENQRIGIEHYEDFKARIPRAEVAEHGDIVLKALRKIDPAFEVIIGGSFRRGSATSGDIDCIITRRDTGADHLRNIVIGQLVPRLTAEGFLVASLAITARDDGSNLRLLASTRGMRLNQRGLYKDVMRGKGRIKLTDGTLVEGKDEKKIFAALGVPWRPPEHRIC
ncbi:DNA polymerase lambda [Pseudocercospora fuligena]|uniref:DNA polymerase lambda n=1 Tax=Pseudocercospora fuligena TaxID=685502 RepID=A0A8H6VCK4_9PEZI|nr:DNA polymerase lambda [Pseudocercospora fuligena]